VGGATMENRSLTTQVIRADHVLPAHGGLAALVPADKERPAVAGDLQAVMLNPELTSVTRLPSTRSVMSPMTPPPPLVLYRSSK